MPDDVPLRENAMSPAKHEQARRWRNRRIVWFCGVWITNFCPPPGWKPTLDGLRKRASEALFGTFVSDENGTCRRATDEDIRAFRLSAYDEGES